MSSSMCSAICTLYKEWDTTEVHVDEANHVWVVNNFDFREAEGGNIFSSEFSAVGNDEFKWRLLLKPNGETNAKDTISFYLNLCSPKTTSKKVYAKYTVFVMDSRHKKVFIAESKINEYDRATKVNPSWGRKELLKKDNNFRKNYLVNKKLTIICDVNFSTVRDAISNTRHQCKTTPLYRNAPLCDLSENFGQLLEHRELADVILSVDGQEYPAHKNILSARCPVFAAMFKHDMRENGQNRIDIEDMTAEVVGEFLKYVYTGKCENVKNVAEGLLAAADKYGLDRLKMICAEELYKTLSVENVANVLLLADMHGVKELKSESIEFIVAKFTEVFNSAAWINNIVLKHSNLANEVYAALSIRTAPDPSAEVPRKSRWPVANLGRLVQKYRNVFFSIK
ncbi:speckle-type POZ protein-like [Planococcus citri]|uniref:speckle-type POZ protein-like n=1 Tax=Planococcus citri TaxID=170843 RepID=UPI0031F900A3